MENLIRRTKLLSTTDPQALQRCFHLFFHVCPCKNSKSINPSCISAGKQRSQISQVSNGRYSYRRHAQYQEHVGERQRRWLLWKSIPSQQGEGKWERRNGRGGQSDLLICDLLFEMPLLSGFGWYQRRRVWTCEQLDGEACGGGEDSSSTCTWTGGSSITSNSKASSKAW